MGSAMSRLLQRKVGTLDPTTDPMAPARYRIQAMVDGLDQVAIAMERKWGVGRLRLLVSDLLRSKFDEQKDRLDTAIVEFLRRKPGASTSQIAAAIKRTTRATQTRLKRLVDLGQLVAIGSSTQDPRKVYHLKQGV